VDRSFVAEPDDREELSVRPGTQAGWTAPLEGEARCHAFGHELDNRAEYLNGLIVGYCARCSARVEIPWFRGGTVHALAIYMVEEAAGMARPAPSVLTDLEQVAGLLSEDISALSEARRMVRNTQREMVKRIGLQ
jgi:hypothetical protein